MQDVILKCGLKNKLSIWHDLGGTKPQQAPKKCSRNRFYQIQANCSRDSRLAGTVSQDLGDGVWVLFIHLSSVIFPWWRWIAWLLCSGCGPGEERAWSVRGGRIVRWGRLGQWSHLTEYVVILQSVTSEGGGQSLAMSSQCINMLSSLCSSLGVEMCSLGCQGRSLGNHSLRQCAR